MRRFVIICLFAAACGCRTAQPTLQPSPPISRDLSALTASVSPAVESAAAATAEASAEAAKPAPDATRLRELLTKISGFIAVVRAECARLVNIAEQAKANEALNDKLLAEIKSLKDELAKEQAESRATWARIALIAAVVAGLGAGLGAWFSNLRLSLASLVAGAVTVALAVLGGAVERWSGAILIAAGVVIVVVLAGIGIEYWRNGGFRNALRETDED